MKILFLIYKLRMLMKKEKSHQHSNKKKRKKRKEKTDPKNFYYVDEFTKLMEIGFMKDTTLVFMNISFLKLLLNLEVLK